MRRAGEATDTRPPTLEFPILYRGAATSTCKFSQTAATINNRLKVGHTPADARGKAAQEAANHGSSSTSSAPDYSLLTPRLSLLRYAAEDKVASTLEVAAGHKGHNEGRKDGQGHVAEQPGSDAEEELALGREEGTSHPDLGRGARRQKEDQTVHEEIQGVGLPGDDGLRGGAGLLLLLYVSSRYSRDGQGVCGRDRGRTVRRMDYGDVRAV